MPASQSLQDSHTGARTNSCHNSASERGGSSSPLFGDVTQVSHNLKHTPERGSPARQHRDTHGDPEKFSEVLDNVHNLIHTGKTEAFRPTYPDGADFFTIDDRTSDKSEAYPKTKLTLTAYERWLESQKNSLPFRNDLKPFFKDETYGDQVITLFNNLSLEPPGNFSQGPPVFPLIFDFKLFFSEMDRRRASRGLPTEQNERSGRRSVTKNFRAWNSNKWARSPAMTRACAQFLTDLGLEYNDGIKVYPDDYRGAGDHRNIFTNNTSYPPGLVLTPPLANR